MNAIIYDHEMITPKYNIWKYYYNFLNRLDQRDCVKFSLFCAKIVNPNTKENNGCIKLVEKWLKDEKLVTKEELLNDSDAVWYISAFSNAAYTAAASYVSNASSYSAYAVVYTVNSGFIDIINKYLQILLRKTKQFQNNKILEQISKPDIDKLELVDWNMITDIIQEKYNIVHEFSYEDIFSRRCLIELLRREYV